MEYVSLGRVGINMFGTANLHSKGGAERALGAAIRGRRDEVLVTERCLALHICSFSLT